MNSNPEINNYYETLGLGKTATLVDIKAAFRNLALKWHPDKVPENLKKEANHRFIEIYEAYEILSDENRRTEYDLLYEVNFEHKQYYDKRQYPTFEKNLTRQNMANRIKRGKLFNQASYALELLKQKTGPVTMKEITVFMSSKGFHSKTYYDLFNALVDSELVEEVTFNGRKAYQLKKDD